MSEDGVVFQVAVFFQGKVDPVEHGIAGEEHQHIAVYGRNQGGQVPGHVVGIVHVTDLGIIRVVGRDGNQRLMGIIKGGCADKGNVAFRVQQVFLSGKGQLAVDRQGG